MDLLASRTIYDDVWRKVYKYLSSNLWVLGFVAITGGYTRHRLIICNLMAKDIVVELITFSVTMCLSWRKILLRMLSLQQFFVVGLENSLL